MLGIRGLSKTFPGTRALNSVSLEVAPGEIHALVGGNGSGKSTLIKILSGVYQGDGGEIECGGVHALADEMTPATAESMGVRVVHQDLGVFPDLTVAENIFLGSRFDTGAAGRIRWRRVNAKAKLLIDRFEIPASPRSAMRNLSRAAQTQVAIARALRDEDSSPRGILIMDEPTASLPNHEVDVLFESLRRLSARGQAILYVSHRLDEILELTSSVSVLRDGDKTGTWTTSELDEDRLIELILGHRVEEVFPNRTSGETDQQILEIDNLWVGPLRGVNLRLSKGEVVGIAGLLGSGRSELLHAVFGNMRIQRGEMRFQGEPLRCRRPGDAMEQGIALVPENRADEAAFIDLPVYTNISAAVLDDFWRGMRMRERLMRSEGSRLMDAFGIKAASPDVALNTLSGGNQQKAILARWLQRKPQLLLLDEPTQGVDVGARADIYKLIRDAVTEGTAALLVASDFEELVSVADRVLVLRNGRFTAEVTSRDLNAHRLTSLCYADHST